MTDEQNWGRTRIRVGPIAILGGAALAIVVVATLTVSHAQLAASPWPTFHHDPAHTGLSQYDTSANPGTQNWRVAGIGGYSSPAIGADGTIYIGSTPAPAFVGSIGHLYAVNPDGTQKWSFQSGGEVGSSPAVGIDGTIYVGDEEYDSATRSTASHLYAVNPDGTQKWAFTTIAGVSSPAVGADGTIYVGDPNGQLYAVNPDGTQKWVFPAVGGVFSAPAIGADGTIYVGSGDGALYAVTPGGTQEWVFAASAYDFFASSPAVGADGTIYIGSDSGDGNLYAVNPDGTQKWVFFAGDLVESSPAIGADGTIYVGSDDDNLYAVTDHGTSATQKWKFQTGDSVYSSPAIGADGSIYVGSWDGALYAVNPDGTQKWKFQTGDSVYSSPAIGADGSIYVASWDRVAGGGDLYAVGACGAGGSVVVTKVGSGTGAPGKTLSGGAFQVKNTCASPEVVDGATITFSDGAIFSKAKLSAMIKSGVVAASATVKHPSSTTAGTSFVLGKPVPVSPGTTLKFVLSVTIARGHRGSSTQAVTSLVATGASGSAGLPANLGTVSRR